LYEAIIHFQHMLKGCWFVIFTDYKPLVGALHRPTDPKSDWQHRQLLIIAEFTAEVVHIVAYTQLWLAAAVKEQPLQK
jgi:hypothetical protein